MYAPVGFRGETRTAVVCLSLTTQGVDRNSGHLSNRPRHLTHNILITQALHRLILATTLGFGRIYDQGPTQERSMCDFRSHHSNQPRQKAKQSEAALFGAADLSVRQCMGTDVATSD
jgi:hypothetical protein